MEKTLAILCSSFVCFNTQLHLWYVLYRLPIDIPKVGINSTLTTYTTRVKLKSYICKLHRYARNLDSVSELAEIWKSRKISRCRKNGPQMILHCSRQSVLLIAFNRPESPWDCFLPELATFLCASFDLTLGDVGGQCFAYSHIANIDRQPIHLLLYLTHPRFPRVFFS